MTDTISRYDPTVLMHHGIKGQKWGIRRFRRKDGSLTPRGESRLKAAGNYALGKTDYTSYATAGYRARGQKSKAKASEEFDRKVSEYRKSQKSGTRFVKELLMGSTGSLTYDMARVSGSGRIGSWVRSWLDINGTTIAATASGNITGNAFKTKVKVRDDSGNEGYVEAPGVASRIAGDISRRVVDKSLTESGIELSLQQRHLRNKYIRNQTRNKSKKR